MTTIDIYRGPDLFVTIKPDNTSVQSKKVMGDNVLNISFEDRRYIEFAINDHCTVFGERYQFNSIPLVTKISRYLYKYSLSLQAEAYDLAKFQYLFLGVDNTLRESDFSLMGNTGDFIDLVVANANRVSSGWIKGMVVASDYKNLTFKTENCYNALGRIAQEFKTEFWIVGKTISLTKKSVETGNTYRHGRNNGLYEITRKTLDNSSVITRLYAWGSEKNLPVDYGTRRLAFPGGYDPCLVSSVECVVTDNGDGTNTYDFTWVPPLSPGVTTVQIEYRNIGQTDWTNDAGSPTTPRSVTLPNGFGGYEFRFRTFGSTCFDVAPGFGIATPIVQILVSTVTPLLLHSPLPFIEKNVNKYGVIEATELFEDIYPHRTGTVTAVDIGNPFTFIDADIDFNVNLQLLPGLTAKVTFNTGQLSGYTFEISTFDNALKKFTLLKNKDERILDIPSTLLRPAIGDTYVLTDINMPTTYVQAAEQALLNAALALLDQISVPQLSYTMIFDPVYLKSMLRTLSIGDLVWIIDDELLLQRKIRMISTIRNIVNEYQYQVDLSDTISPGTISLIINAQSSTERDVQQINQQLLNNSLLNNNVIGDLTVKLGTLIFEDLPTTATDTGFSQLRIEDATGKIFKKI